MSMGPAKDTRPLKCLPTVGSCPSSKYTMELLLGHFCFR